ncbi:hypothetical protein YPPY66_2603, partial [Yersinia pestis PY-66]
MGRDKLYTQNNSSGRKAVREIHISREP